MFFMQLIMVDSSAMLVEKPMNPQYSRNRGGGFRAKKGSEMRQKILSLLKNLPATNREIYSALNEQWDLGQIKNGLLNMYQELLVNKAGHGKKAIYSIRPFGHTYLEEAARGEHSELERANLR